MSNTPPLHNINIPANNFSLFSPFSFYSAASETLTAFDRINSKRDLSISILKLTTRSLSCCTQSGFLKASRLMPIKTAKEILMDWSGGNNTSNRFSADKII